MFADSNIINCSQPFKRQFQPKALMRKCFHPIFLRTLTLADALMSSIAFYNINCTDETLIRDDRRNLSVQQLIETRRLYSTIGILRAICRGRLKPYLEEKNGPFRSGRPAPGWSGQYTDISSASWEIPTGAYRSSTTRIKWLRSNAHTGGKTSGVLAGFPTPRVGHPRLLSQFNSSNPEKT